MNENQWEKFQFDITKFQLGDGEQFEYIFEKYCKPVINYIQRITKHTEVGEDIALGIFLKLYKKREEFEDEKNIKNWLFLVAKNTTISHLRKEINIKKRKEEIQYLSQNVSMGEDPERTGAEVIKEIIKDLSDLTDREKQVFHLLYRDEKTTKEVAKELDISISAVDAHKSNLTKKIRNMVIRKGLGFLLLFLFLFDLFKK